MEGSREEDIVIVGSGICGLATALALYRKGIRSIVLEKSEDLRTTGVGIIMRQHGWTALDQLGVASSLRQSSIEIQFGDYISVHDDAKRNKITGSGEIRCVRRMKLIKVLADSLPNDSIFFGRQVVSVEMDEVTSSPVLHLHDGSVIKAKIVIGCDGINSTIAKFIGLNPPKFYPLTVVRGLSYYEKGHDYSNLFNMFSNNHVQLGVLPIDHHWVYWFVTRKWTSTDPRISRDVKLIKETTMEGLNGFKEREIQLIMNTDLKSCHLAGVKYRPPLDLLISNFRKQSVTVAGDAMHAMGPFLAQGGSASLEDAVMLASCLAEKIKKKKSMVEEGIDEFLERRRMIVFWVSLQTYLIGATIHSSFFQKIFSIILLIFLFRD